MTMDYYSSPAASIILVHALHRSTSVRTTPAMPDINRSGSFGSPETPWQLTSQGRMHQSVSCARPLRAVANRRPSLPD
jgi:hypothetical protein